MREGGGTGGQSQKENERGCSNRVQDCENGTASVKGGGLVEQHGVAQEAGRLGGRFAD
jgi:hypothetical protein